jgi:hypothetical protein
MKLYLLKFLKIDPSEIRKEGIQDGDQGAELESVNSMMPKSC